jgi:hypothetical protein
VSVPAAEKKTDCSQFLVILFSSDAWHSIQPSP